MTAGARPIFETKNDLSPEVRGRVAELLNQRLADAVGFGAVVIAALASLRAART